MSSNKASPERGAAGGTGFLLLCCRSCLKSGSTTSYYEALGVDKRADVNQIKKGYKRICLALHPDKIAQRGATVTEDDKLQLLRVKEAYQVLVDPKRRRLYDKLGDMGLKLVEDPSQLMQPEIQAKVVSNFQRNSKDRYLLFAAILAVYASIAIFPILFSLKCDGYIPQVPWSALWTPLWLVNVFLLAGALSLFFIQEEEEDAEGNVTAVPMTWSDVADGLANFALTSAWVLIQVFLVLRLDQVTAWSWYAVFAPWFAYDALKIIVLFHPAFLEKIAQPDFSTLQSGPEDEEGGDEGDDVKFMAEMDYYQALMRQQSEMGQIVTSALRIWLAGFLAYKLNYITATSPVGNNDWNWGLVMLPVWVWILFMYVEAFRNFFAGKGISAALADQDPESLPPSAQVKMQYAQGLGSSCAASCFCSGPVFILMSVLLVCSLEVKPITTFVIILPVFIALLVLLACILTLYCCLSTIDSDEIERAAEEYRAGGSEYSPPTPSDADKEANADEEDIVISPVIVVIPEPEPTPAPAASVAAVQEPLIELTEPEPEPAPVGAKPATSDANDID